MCNHWHSLTTPTAENLPEILEYLFGESSKFIKVCLAEHGYEPPESVWSGSTRPNLGRMMTPEAQLKWAHYIPSNPVTAGLVERFSEYPGHVTGHEVLAGKTVVIERPDFYFSKRNNPESVELTYSMPPLLRQAFGSSEKIIYQLQRALADTEKACRERGGPVLGAEAVKAQHPWSEPRSPRTFSQGFSPGLIPVFEVDSGHCDYVGARRVKKSEPPVRTCLTQIRHPRSRIDTALAPARLDHDSGRAHLRPEFASKLDFRASCLNKYPRTLNVRASR